jgi:hypothetical protein
MDREGPHFIQVDAGTSGHHIDGSTWTAPVNGTYFYVTPAGNLQWINNPSALTDKKAILASQGVNSPQTWDNAVANPDAFGYLEGDKPA